MFKRTAPFLCLLIFAVAASARADSIVYDNSTSTSYSSLGLGAAINDGYSTTDSFSLSSAATIDAISFGDVLYPGDVLISVDWQITTALNGGTTIGSGEATTFSNVVEHSGPDMATVNDSTFDISSLSLSADTTYYLELYDAVAAGSFPSLETFWDFSDNPNSTGYGNGNGYVNYAVPSETFALYGNDVSVTPEPSSLLLLGTGFGGLALLGIMRRRPAAVSGIAVAG